MAAVVAVFGAGAGLGAGYASHDARKQVADAREQASEDRQNGLDFVERLAESYHALEERNNLYMQNWMKQKQKELEEQMKASIQAVADQAPSNQRPGNS
jgi:ABC-type protease/lipase transport system fused ATPase/permease subunit